MARTPVFATIAALSLFACDANEPESAQFRSHHSNGHHHHHHGNGHKGKDGKKHTYPGADWQVGSPEDHDLSSEGLDEMAAIAAETDSSCVVVIRDGVLVGEWYGDGFDANTPIPDVWSVTKSFTSAAIGIAEAEGFLDIHDRASDYIPQWQGTDIEDVTIFDLMTHISGREWDFASDLAMFGMSEQTDYSLSFGRDLPPGTRFDYSDVGVQSLEAVLKNATGQEVSDYMQAKVFAPIGMSATMAHDAAGDTVTYTGISATCRDLARFGYLYLRNGRWRNEHVVPKWWVKESAEPATDLNDAYGLMWWLNNPGHVVLSTSPLGRPEFEGKLLPSAPDQMYMAFGAFGQVIAVDPSSDMVIVRTTIEYDLGNPYGLEDMDAIIGAIEDAKLDDCD